MTIEAIIAPTKPFLKRPPLYKIMIFDDDITKYQCVIDIAVKYFNKTPDEAYEVAFRVDARGADMVGVYSKDVAETKVKMAKAELKALGAPLRIELFESI